MVEMISYEMSMRVPGIIERATATETVNVLINLTLNIMHSSSIFPVTFGVGRIHCSWEMQRIHLNKNKNSNGMQMTKQ